MSSYSVNGKQEPETKYCSSTKVGAGQLSRRVLSWRLSITLEVDFCIEAVEEALARHGKPDIFNTDQGSLHLAGLHAGLEGCRDRHPHGWQGSLAGHCLC